MKRNPKRTSQLAYRARWSSSNTTIRYETSPRSNRRADETECQNGGGKRGVPCTRQGRWPRGRCSRRCARRAPSAAAASGGWCPRRRAAPWTPGAWSPRRRKPRHHHPPAHRPAAPWPRAPSPLSARSSRLPSLPPPNRNRTSDAEIWREAGGPTSRWAGDRARDRERESGRIREALCRF
jgi:hypothetical protein